MKVIPLSNQSLLDIALQYLGDAGRAFEIAELNNIQVSADLSQISELILPDMIAKKKKATVNSYKDKRIIPASKWDFYGLYGDWEIDPIGGELADNATLVLMFSDLHFPVDGAGFDIHFTPLIIAQFFWKTTPVLPNHIEITPTAAGNGYNFKEVVIPWLAANQPDVVLSEGISPYPWTLSFFCKPGGVYDGAAGNSIFVTWYDTGVFVDAAPPKYFTGGID